MSRSNSEPFALVAGPRQDSKSSISTASSRKYLPPVPTRKYTFASSLSDTGSKRRRKRWIAYSLRPPFLCLLALISLCFFGAIEALRQLSISNNGLAFFEGSDSIPTWIYFLYNFLPTILAVPYAWLWNITSTDAKRLEAYFHLSEPGVPLSLLFIDYTFQSPLTAPISAIRRRHWPVVWLGPLSLLTSLIFTASQGGIFGLQQVTFPSQVTFNTWPGLVSPSSQDFAIFPNWTSRESFVTAGQAATLPPFVSANFSVPPFNTSSNLAANETWTVPTHLYWAEPNCEQMNIGSIQVVESRNGTLEDENQDPLDSYGVKNKLFELKLNNLTVPGTQCDISMAIQWFAEFSPSGEENFLPLFDNITDPRNGSIDDFPLAQDRIFRGNSWGAMFGTCPEFRWWAGLVRYTWFDSEPDAAPNSLAVFASASSPNFIQFTVAATACSAKYYSAPGQATVRGQDQTVLAAETSEPGSELTEEQFKPSAFENSLQVISSVEDPGFENVTFEVELGNFDVLYGANDQFSTIAVKSVANVSNLLTGTQWSSGISGAWNLGFAIAFQSVFDVNATADSLDGFKVTTAVAVTVVTAFALLSESILLLAAVTAVVTLLVYRHRDNVLQSDPDSLAAMCSLAEDLLTEKTLAEFGTDNFDTASTSTLKGELCKAKLLTTPDDMLLTYFSNQNTDKPPSKALPSPARTAVDRKSFFLTTFGWIFSFFCLVLILAGTMTAFVFSVNGNGFTFLADLDDFTAQLLYSFAPTLIATIIDASFQQVHRDMGVLEAFVRLSNRYQNVADSLTLRYSSRPCVITAWPAIRRKHWFMAFLSLVCISTSILNVVSAALFTQAFVTIQTPATFTSTFSATTLPSTWNHLTFDMSRPFEAVEAVLIGGMPQQPWTDTQYSYLPVAMIGDDLDQASLTTAPTIAIGVEYNCESISPQPNATDQDRGTITQEGTPGVSLTNKTAFWSINDPILNKSVRCSVEWQDIAGEPGNSSITVAPLTIGGDEFASVTPETDGTICGRFTTFVLATVSVDNKTETDLAWTCSPSLSVRDATVTFTRAGEVVSTVIEPTTSAETESFFANQTEFVGNFADSYAEFSTDTLSQIAGGTFDFAGQLCLAVQNNTFDADNFNVTSSAVFARVFAAFFSIYRDDLLATPKLSPSNSSTSPFARRSVNSVPGTQATRQARIVSSSPLFVITIALLTVYLVTSVIVLVARRSRFNGPRVPKSLGAILPWVAHSRILREMRGLHALSSSERERVLQRRATKYGFGWFVDESGHWRLGLEQEPYVTRATEEGPGEQVPMLGRDFVESPVVDKGSLEDRFGAPNHLEALKVEHAPVSPL